MISKPFYQSKLFWTGFVTVLVSVLAFLQTFLQNEPWVIDVPWLLPLIGILLGIAIIVERVITTQPITLRRRPTRSTTGTYNA